MAKLPHEPMPWLKLWHRFLDSAKIQRVTEALRARYVNLLCVACKENANGRLPNVEMVAFMMRLSCEEAQETLNSLVDSGLIEYRAKSYYIHDWDDWQAYKSPAAIRQQRVRDKRNALRNGDATELRNDFDTGGATTRARASESESSSESQEGGPGGNHISEPGPEFVTLGNLGIELSCDTSMGQWVLNMARLGHAATAIRYALEEGASAGQWGHKWLQGILKRVATEGLPKPNHSKLANGRPDPGAPKPEDPEHVRRRAEFIKATMVEPKKKEPDA